MQSISHIEGPAPFLLASEESIIDDCKSHKGTYISMPPTERYRAPEVDANRPAATTWKTVDMAYHNIKGKF